jgi:hypothetical protein
MARQFRSDDTSIWQEGFGNGSDGAVTISTNTTQSPTDSACTGTSGTTTLSATNGGFGAGKNILIHQTRGTGMGNWELNVIASYTTGTITLKYPLQNSYVTGAQTIVLGNYTDVTINTGVTFSAKAWDGSVGGIIGWIANGTTTITGTVSANISGFRGGYASSTNNQNGWAGENQTRTVNGTQATSAENQSAGGGGFGISGTKAPGAGGGGGYATSGTAGGAQESTGGSGGGTIGSADLTSLHFGGSGGGGGGITGYSVGQGNSGAGIVLIFSKNISITGSITCNGGNGTGSTYCGGGGSAGGSILIKAQTATLGTTKMTATGGSGGTASQNFGLGGTGGTGGVGRIHLDYLTSYSGTSSPTLDVRQDNTLFSRFAGGSFLYNFI